jgi:glutamate racemase
MDLPIGVFDSGVGGLTVLRELIKILPNEKIIYYADTAHTPYGNKSKESILKLSKQIIYFLLKNKIKLLVVACNTISANCHKELLNEFEIPIIEVLESGIKKSIEIKKNKSICIVGTESTIKSHVYEKKILIKNPMAKIYLRSCPLFVSLAEEGLMNNKISYEITKMYFENLIDKEIDYLVLACTHYPLFAKYMKKIMLKTNIIDPAIDTAISVKKFLESKKIARSKENNSDIFFYVSGDVKKFYSISKLILNKKYPIENFIYHDATHDTTVVKEKYLV